jgi:hypothetical protein
VPSDSSYGEIFISSAAEEFFEKFCCHYIFCHRRFLLGVYKTLGEVKIRSFVQEISSKDRFDNTFFNKTYLLNTFKPFSGHKN